MKTALLAIALVLASCGKAPEPPACAPQPVADGGGDAYIVQAAGYPQMVQVGTKPVPGMTYSWSPNDGLTAADVAQPFAQPLKSTSYVLTVSSKCGQATAAVTVHILKQAAAPSDFKVMVDGQAYYTGYVRNPLREKRAQFRTFESNGKNMSREIPAEFDLRKRTPVTIENQGNCGSCWLFGGKAAVAWLIRDRDGKLAMVSGQWGLDCNGQLSFSGCGGGDMMLSAFKSPQGVIYEPGHGQSDAYPRAYSAREYSCESSWLKAQNHYHEQLIDWGYVGTSGGGATVVQMQQAMMDTDGPLVISLAAGGLNIDHNGVMTSCQGGGINHISYLIGWKAINGKVYWIYVNSWGESFGDHGVAYIAAEGSNGTRCAGIGTDEVAYMTYKPACTPQPKADGGPDQTLLMVPGMPKVAVIGTQALAGTTYSWSPVDSLDDAHAAQVLASPKKTTVYTVTATTKCGAATSQVTVHVYHDRKGAAR